VRIFTVGVGTPQGSLIPVTSDNGETSFVKDSAGQVVKSKLDDKRLREVAEATGGLPTFGKWTAHDAAGSE